MLQEVLLPQLGQTMEEGTIEKWHKKEGDKVKKGEVLFELTTDKATLEVESFADGLLKKILVEEGKTVPVNELVAIIGEEDDELPEDLSALREKTKESVEVAESTEDQATAQQETVSSGISPGSDAAARVFISPRARKLAEENEIPVNILSGSGPQGRIIERDIETYLDELSQINYTPTAREVAIRQGVDLRGLEPAEGATRITREDVQRAAEEGAATGTVSGSNRVELPAMRQTIAQRMAESKQSVPHFYLVGQINMRAAAEYRQELNMSADVHITFTDLLVKAAGLAMKDHPRVNARFDGDSILLNSKANVGVAVAVEDGLFVPVIHNADRRNLKEISSDLKSLAATAREGKLRPDQYEGGSLTISNLGTYGVDYFIPIINPPESCIIGVGKIAEEVIAEDGAIRIEPLMKVTISADHRVVDGAQAAEFYATFRDLLENPEKL
ncbi:MAG: 2-oxo acid dehydrogenase subunit E2 [Planctomycetes bacterium]|nr:2-oxo acid dehydrogenase subunit E2 [Planctomycetota bacterium]